MLQFEPLRYRHLTGQPKMQTTVQVEGVAPLLCDRAQFHLVRCADLRCDEPVTGGDCRDVARDLIIDRPDPPTPYAR